MFTPIGYFQSLGYDADAQAFFTSVEGGGDTLTDAQKNAVNQLVVDLKGYSLWDSMVAVYPYVGGTATAHKWNLKDPRDLDAAYRITWGSAVIHGSMGVKGTENDHSSYGDTHYNSVTEADTGFTVGMYINAGLDSTPASVYDWGAFDGTNDTMISLGYNNTSTKYAAFDGTSYVSTTGGTYDQSFFAGSNDGTNTTIWQDGSSVTTSAQSYDPANFSLTMLASNRSGGTQEETGRGHGIAIMANEGYDSTQMSNLNTSISNFVTSLSKNTGPLLDLYGDSAIAAYSVRLLSSAYTGDCLQVQRSSDNATQDIGFVDGYLDTAAMLSFVGANDGRVSIWYDQSGNARDLDDNNYDLPLIVDAGTLVTNPDNGKVGLYSDTYETQLQTSTIVNPLADSGGIYSITNVHRLEDRLGDTVAQIYNLDNNSARLMQYRINTDVTNQDITFIITFGNSPFVQDMSFSMPLQQTLLSTYLRSSTDGKTYVDGVLKGTNIATARTNQRPRLQLFSRDIPTNSGNETFTGYHQEFILWNADKTSYQSDIEDNINTYWSIY